MTKLNAKKPDKSKKSFGKAATPQPNKASKQFPPKSTPKSEPPRKKPKQESDSNSDLSDKDFEALLGMKPSTEKKQASQVRNTQSPKQRTPGKKNEMQSPGPKTPINTPGNKKNQVTPGKNMLQSPPVLGSGKKSPVAGIPGNKTPITTSVTPGKKMADTPAKKGKTPVASNTPGKKEQLTPAGLTPGKKTPGAGKNQESTPARATGGKRAKVETPGSQKKFSAAPTSPVKTEQTPSGAVKMAAGAAMSPGKKKNKQPSVPGKKRSRADDSSDGEEEFETAQKKHALEDEDDDNDSGDDEEHSDDENDKENGRAKEVPVPGKKRLHANSDAETPKTIRESASGKKRKLSEGDQADTTSRSTDFVSTDLAKDQIIKEQRNRRSLFIKNFPAEVAESTIRALSTDIQDVRIKQFFTKRQFKRRGCAYLEFKDEAAADRNHKLLAGKKIGDTPVVVDYVGKKSAYRKANKQASTTPDDFDSKRLYVSGFDNDMTTQKLDHIFTTAHSIQLPTAKKTGQPIGYAFIAYTSDAECRKAHDLAQGKVINGRHLVVLFAKKSKKSGTSLDLGTSDKGRMPTGQSAAREVSGAATKSTNISAMNVKNTPVMQSKDDDDDSDDSMDDDDE